MGKRTAPAPATAASPARARKRARAASDGDAPSSHSFVAVRHPRSALADALEWVGDAVAGELAARVLLARFSSAPLSARVFRSLLLGVVSNRNLALVCERMGYATSTSASTTVKDKADVVEAVVGELAVRLAARERLENQHAHRQLRRHLDALLATALRAHFGVRTRARQLGGGGQLRLSRNMFACLPEEQLDEATGELRVVAGSFEEEEEEAEDMDTAQQQHKSVADFLDEGDESAGGGAHHAFALVAATEGGGSGDVDDDDEGPNHQHVRARVRAAMARVGTDHVLRASKEVFEVFKIYGMTVLAERVSLALAEPHLLHPRALVATTAVSVTPAELTRQRQRVLSVANMAHCSSVLGVSSTQVFVDRCGGDGDDDYDARRAAEERLRANTLRAFVGYHSAVATTSSAAKQRSSALVNGVCQFLQAESSEAEPRDQGDEGSDRRRHATPRGIPEREPLVSLMQSLGEAKAFMSSKTCDELHQPGERPAGASVGNEAFLLRQCDSEEVENLFETLAKDHEREKRRALDQERADKSHQTKKRKANKAVSGASGNSGGSAALAANLTRFQHRRFLFCLEEIVVLFAQRKTDECRKCIASFERELEPCAGSECFRKWEVSTSTLTLAMRDSFYRLLLHDVCQFHQVASSSKNTRDGTRITQLRLPLHYTWAKVARRITTELEATA